MDNFNYSKNNQTSLLTEDVSSMCYHDDMKLEDKTKVFNYIVELLKFKRNKYLSFQAKSAPGGFQRSFLLFCILFANTLFVAIVVRDFYVVLYMTICCVLVTVLIELFVSPRFSKYINDQSYVVYDREINSTLSSKGFNIFGVDIEDDNAFSNPNDLCNIQVFRNDINHEIVGVVCLKPLSDMQENFLSSKTVLKIGILGSSAIDKISERIQQEMFDWCFTKAQVLKQSSNDDVFLQIEVLGIDTNTVSFLREKKFTHIFSTQTGNSSLFDISPAFQMQLWELMV